jgi:hypothetical protein
MNARERIKLLFGPYKAPALRRGDRSFCLYRDCDVVIGSWTAARISWPRCRALDCRAGGWGLLVDEELARAIRQESAAALVHWWGVHSSTVRLWRKAFGVGRMDNAGSRRLILAASEQAAEQVRGVPLSAEQCELRRQNVIKNRLLQRLQPGYQGPMWTAEQLALLGTLPDDEIAVRIGKTKLAVSLKRRSLGIAHPYDRRRRECNAGGTDAVGAGGRGDGLAGAVGASASRCPN